MKNIIARKALSVILFIVIITSYLVQSSIRLDAKNSQENIAEFYAGTTMFYKFANWIIVFQLC